MVVGPNLELKTRHRSLNEEKVHSGATRHNASKHQHLDYADCDVAPPDGESLKDTAARVLPFYLTDILPAVMRGQQVLVVAHGNSIRALVMVLEGLTPEAITKVEFATGEMLIYDLAADTRVEAKSVISARADMPASASDS